MPIKIDYFCLNVIINNIDAFSMQIQIRIVFITKDDLEENTKCT